MDHALFFRVAILTKKLKNKIFTTIVIWGMLTYVLRHQESNKTIIFAQKCSVFELDSLARPAGRTPGMYRHDARFQYHSPGAQRSLCAFQSPEGLRAVCGQFDSVEQD